LPPEGGRRSGATRRAPEKASERLRRLLTVVPYLVRNQGTRVAEAADLFGMSEPELLADLDLLFVSGLPPYGPGDLIDVDIQDGRIWIGMADYFARPLRLTRSEALALYLEGTALLGTPGLAEAGLEASMRALQVRPKWWTTLEVLICCHAALGKWNEASNCAQEMATVVKQPGDVLAPLKAKNPAWTKQMSEALSKAGA